MTIEVELVGADTVPGAPSPAETTRLCVAALAAAGVSDGHLAVQYVDEERIAELNEAHRGRGGPTDVLSFGVDEAGPAAGPRELGDIVICASQTADLREAIVHGALHLAGLDHETDNGEMLVLQDRLMQRLGAGA